MYTAGFLPLAIALSLVNATPLAFANCLGSAAEAAPPAPLAATRSPGFLSRLFGPELPGVGRRNVVATPDASRPQAIVDMPMNRVVSDPDFPPLSIANMKYNDKLTELNGTVWELAVIRDDTQLLLYRGDGSEIRRVPTRPVATVVHRYRLRVTNPANAAEHHDIELLIPSNPGLRRDERTLRSIQDRVAELPWNRIDAIQLIRFNLQNNFWDPHWRNRYNDFTRSAATGGGSDGRRVIDIYPSGVDASAGLLRHEFGHTIAFQEWSTTTPPERWLQAMRKDGRSVSQYADNSPEEDFAETVQRYLEVDGGSLSSRYRARYAERFAILDELFGSNPEARTRTRWNVMKGLIVLDVTATTLLFSVGATVLVRADEVSTGPSPGRLPSPTPTPTPQGTGLRVRN